MNKRISKKKNRIRKLNLFELSFSDQIEYFYLRNVRRAPKGYFNAWEAADFLRKRSAYKISDREDIISED